MLNLEDNELQVIEPNLGLCCTLTELNVNKIACGASA